jgi:hypothetical protein
MSVVLRIAMAGVSELVSGFQRSERAAASFNNMLDRRAVPWRYAAQRTRLEASIAARAQEMSIWHGAQNAALWIPNALSGNGLSPSAAYQVPALSTGGSGASFGRGASYGGMMGMSPSDVAGAANSFRDRLGTDPFAMMAFGKPVISDKIGGPGDNVKLLITAIDQLAVIENQQTRLLQARRMGLENFLWMADLTGGQRQMLKESGAQTGSLHNLNRGADARNNYLEQLGNDQWAQVRETWLPALSGFGQQMKLGAGWIANNIFPALQTAHRAWAAVHGDGQGGGSSALDKNTQALEDLAYMFRDSQRTVYGGGQLGGLAIPPGLKGFRLQEALHSETITLGGVAR